MDLATLIRKVIDQLKHAKSQFDGSNSHEDKKNAYDEYINGVEKLHKIYKSQNTTPTATKKIKEILTSALTDANGMKQKLNDMPKTNNNSSSRKNNSSHSNNNVNKGKPNGAPPDKDKTKLEGALSGAIITEKPNVKWTDVAGLENAKRSLQEAIILPVKFPDIFVGLRKPWKGILLYGPPGTGKTYLAKACATQADSTFFSVSSADLISKFVGESEKLIKTLFEMARAQAPSIIFIDEIDSLVSARSSGENEASRRVKTEFLVQMQGVGNANEKVLVLGATNLPWALDPAVRRRFEKRIYITLPDEEARMYLLRNKLKGLDENLSDEDLKKVAMKTDGYSGSDLEVLAKDAAMEPLRFAQVTKNFKKVVMNGKDMFMPIKNGKADFVGSVYDLPQHSLVLPPLSKMDLINSLEKSKPSVADDDLKGFIDWAKEFGSE